MITDVIYKEDCLLTQERNIPYDYVLTSPPDYDEIGMDPNDEIGSIAYEMFLTQRLTGLKPSSGYITIFISDRKSGGKIIPKAQLITKIMKNFELVSYKIWVKSKRINLYRFNFTHILTFRDSKIKKKIPFIYPDVIEFPQVNEGTYRDNFQISVVKPFIENYTKEEQVVFDPFIGVGTTALACIELNRHYFGSEIDEKVYDLAMDNIERNNNPLMNMIGG